MRRLFIIFICGVLTTSSVFCQDAFINEFHYDNESADEGEGIEIAVTNSLDLTNGGLQVVLYNGSDSMVYNSHIVDADNFVVGEVVEGFTFYYKYISGIQNGPNDAIALVYNGEVIQFISYEGEIEAMDGAAIGMVSEDIEVAEGSSTPLESSIQLIGAGNGYNDFIWVTDATVSFGNINEGQTIPTDNIVGYNSIGIINSINVYPNPVSNVLNIIVESENYSDLLIQLSNLKGQIVYTNHISDVSAHNSFINTKDLKGGIYNLRIITANTIRTEKIIVQ